MKMYSRPEFTWAMFWGLVILDTVTSTVGIPHSNEIGQLADLIEQPPYTFGLIPFLKGSFSSLTPSAPPLPPPHSLYIKTKILRKCKPLVHVSADLAQETRWSVKYILTNNFRLPGVQTHMAGDDCKVSALLLAQGPEVGEVNLVWYALINIKFHASDYSQLLA